MAEVRRRRRGSLLVVAVLVGGTVAGCGTVPSAGDIRYGRAVNQGGVGLDDTDIHVLPPAPAAGVAAQDVLRGFLRASANFDDDHAIARRYLTREAADSWDPDAGITIYDPAVSGLRLTSGATGATSPQTLTLQAPRIATIAADGAYDAAPGAVAAPFRLVRQGGEWRLAGVPRGLLLTPTDVQRDLRSVYTYFLDPTSRVVVPDHVFLKAPARGRPTALVRSLLDGPTRWLAPAVTTAFPPGTKLIGNAPLDGTVVVVNLSPEAGRAQDEARVAMSAQLVWTLRQLPDITGVRIEVDGSPLPVPGAGDVQPISDWSSFDPDPQRPPPGFYFLANGRLRGEDGRPAPGPLGQRGLSLVRPSFGGEVVAGLRTGATGTELYAAARGAVPTLRLRAGPGELTPPSVDGSGAVWTLRRGASPAVLLLVSPGAATSPLAVVPAGPLLSLGAIAELGISRDGTRAAAIVGSGASSRLVVGRVVPGRGSARSLEGFRVVAPGLRALASLSWADSHRLAVVSVGRSATRSPWLVEADGSAVTPVGTTGLPPGGPDQLAAGPGDVFLAAAGGSIYRSSGGFWTSIAAGTDPTRAG